MRIEAFTEAKQFGAPETNEDALLVLPGRAFAVMDGVTDRVGTRYGGVLSGRYASHLLQRTLEAHLAVPGSDPWTAVDACTAAIRDAYDRAGTTEAVRTDPNRQMAATLALVVLTETEAQVVLVGDSAVRLNGTTVWQENKDIDTITATLRRIAWARAAATGADVGTCERVARAVAWSGTGTAGALVAPVLDGADLHAVARDAEAAACAALPHLPAAVVAAVVAGGIVHGQGGHQNDPGSPLGYPSLNGFPVPRSMVRVERVPRAALRTVELWTDGYFAPAAGFGVAAWEARFRETEREDPHKIGPHPSTKGTTATNWADDRTYLGVELGAAGG